MTRFKPWTSGIGSYRSTNWAKPLPHWAIFVKLHNFYPQGSHSYTNLESVIGISSLMMRETNSVTRLGYFWKILAIVAPIFGDFWAYFCKIGLLNLKVLWILFGLLLEIWATFNFNFWSHWREEKKFNKIQRFLTRTRLQSLFDGSADWQKSAKFKNIFFFRKSTFTSKQCDQIKIAKCL